MKTRKYSKSSLRSRRPFWIAILIGAFWLAGPGYSQPVTVPQVTPPSFQSTDVDPLADAADGSNAQHGWEQIVDVGLQTLATAWEAGVDADIGTLLAGVGQSDFFNANPAYRDYLQKELEIQKQTGAADWELAADTAAQERRTLFLASLSEQNYNEATQESTDALRQANQDDLTELDRQRYLWDREFREEIDSGFRDFQSALNGIASDYNELIGALDQKEQEFQQGRAQIDQYEQLVRNGIQQAVNNLGGMVGSGMFHDEVCDAQNVCTQGALNASGQQLQTLLNDLNAGLQNNAPVSTLTQQMITFLQQQHAYSVTRQQYWEGLATVENVPYTSEYQPGATYIWATVCNPFCAPQIVGKNIPPLAQAVMDFNKVPVPPTSPRDDTALINWLQANHESRQIVSIHPISHFQGESAYHNGGPLSLPDFQQFGLSGNEWSMLRNNHIPYVNETFNAGLYYQRFQFLASFLPPSNHVPEFNTYLHYRITYTVFDPNADANANTWQGYANNLDSILQHWQNNLMPAIQNWEAQTASYDTNFAAWQAQAQSQRAQALNDRTQREQEIVGKRSRWIARMEQRQQEDRRQWNNLRDNLARTTSVSAAANDPELSEGTRTALGRLAASRHARQTGLSARDFRLGYRKEQIDLLRDQSATLPDGEKYLNVARTFQSSVQGVVNLGVARNLDERAERQRQQAIENIRSAAQAQDGLIQQQRNLPARARAIDDEIKEINKQKRRVFDRVFLGQNVDFIMEKNTDENTGRIAHMLGGPDHDYVRSLEDKIDALRKERSQVLEDDRKNHFGKDGNFKVAKEEENGAIRVQRTISKGRAILNAGGDIENADDYHSDDGIQAFTLAAPGSVKLVETGSLFDDWDYQKVTQSFSQNAAAYDASLQDHYRNKMGKAIADANTALMKAESAWRNDAQGQAAQAKKNRMMLESIAKAMMGGAGLGDALFDVAKNELTSQVAQAIGEATGLPVGLLSGLLSGQPPMEALASHMQNSLLNFWESESGVPGLGAWIGELHAKQKAKQKRRADAKLDTKDLVMAMATGGSSMYTSLLDAAGAHHLSDQFKNMRGFGQLMGLQSGMMHFADILPPQANLLSKALGGLDSFLNPTIAEVESLVDGDVSFDQYAKNRAQQREQTATDFFNKPLKGAFNMVQQLPLISVPKALMSKPQKVRGPGEKAVRQGLVDLAAEMNPALPKALLSSSFVHGADLKTAMIRQFAAHLAAGAGAKGFAAEQIEELLAGQITKAIERHELKKKRKRAARIRPEDILLTATGIAPITYAWRNAQFHKEGSLALGGVETVVGGLLDATIIGKIVTMGYHGAKQGYIGSLNAGTVGGLTGFISGVGGAALSFGSSGLFGGNLEYDKDKGFSGGFKFNPLGMGGGAASLLDELGLDPSLSLNFAEGEGITNFGYGLDLEGFGPGFLEELLGASASLNIDQYGNVTGGVGVNAGLFEDENTKYKGGLDIKFNENGVSDVGFDFSSTTTRPGANSSLDEGYVDFGNPYLNNMLNGGSSTYEWGVGLSFGLQGQGNSFSLNSGSSYGNKAASGLSGFGWKSSGNWGIGNDNFRASESRLNFSLQSREDAEKYINRELATQRELKKQLAADDPARAVIEGRIEELERRQKLARSGGEVLTQKLTQANDERMAWNELIKAENKKRAAAGLSPLPLLETWSEEDIAELVRNPEKLHNENMKDLLEDAGIATTQSPTNIFSEIGGGITNGLKWLAGADSDNLGEFDPATGEFRVKTCFVAGTKVRTRDGYKNIEDVEIGELVYSWNEKTGDINVRPVTTIFIRTSPDIYSIEYANGTKIQTTWSHPFYVEGRGWVRASDLKPDDKSIVMGSLESESIAMESNGSMLDSLLLAKTGNALKIERVEIISKETIVYNLEVAVDHTYFVSTHDILVHNQVRSNRDTYGEGGIDIPLEGEGGARGRYGNPVQEELEEHRHRSRRREMILCMGTYSEAEPCTSESLEIEGEAPPGGKATLFATREEVALAREKARLEKERLEKERLEKEKKEKEAANRKLLKDIWDFFESVDPTPEQTLEGLKEAREKFTTEEYQEKMEEIQNDPDAPEEVRRGAELQILESRLRPTEAEYAEYEKEYQIERERARQEFPDASPEELDKHKDYFYREKLRERGVPSPESDAGVDYRDSMDCLSRGKAADCMAPRRKIEREIRENSRGQEGSPTGTQGYLERPSDEVQLLAGGNATVPNKKKIELEQPKLKYVPPPKIKQPPWRKQYRPSGPTKSNKRAELEVDEPEEEESMLADLGGWFSDAGSAIGGAVTGALAGGIELTGWESAANWMRGDGYIDNGLLANQMLLAAHKRQEPSWIKDFKPVGPTSATGFRASRELTPEDDGMLARFNTTDTSALESDAGPAPTITLPTAMGNSGEEVVVESEDGEEPGVLASIGNWFADTGSTVGGWFSDAGSAIGSAVTNTVASGVEFVGWESAANWMRGDGYIDNAALEERQLAEYQNYLAEKELAEFERLAGFDSTGMIYQGEITEGAREGARIYLDPDKEEYIVVTGPLPPRPKKKSTSSSGAKPDLSAGLPNHLLAEGLLDVFDRAIGPKTRYIASSSGRDADFRINHDENTAEHEQLREKRLKDLFDENGPADHDAGAESALGVFAKVKLIEGAVGVLATGTQIVMEDGDAANDIRKDAEKGIQELIEDHLKDKPLAFQVGFLRAYADLGDAEVVISALGAIYGTTMFARQIGKTLERAQKHIPDFNVTPQRLPANREVPQGITQPDTQLRKAAGGPESSINPDELPPHLKPKEKNITKQEEMNRRMMELSEEERHELSRRYTEAVTEYERRMKNEKERLEELANQKPEDIARLGAELENEQFQFKVKAIEQQILTARNSRNATEEKKYRNLLKHLEEGRKFRPKKADTIYDDKSLEPDAPEWNKGKDDQSGWSPARNPVQTANAEYATEPAPTITLPTAMGNSSEEVVIESDGEEPGVLASIGNWFADTGSTVGGWFSDAGSAISDTVASGVELVGWESAANWLRGDGYIDNAALEERQLAEARETAREVARTVAKRAREIAEQRGIEEASPLVLTSGPMSGLEYAAPYLPCGFRELSGDPCSDEEIDQARKIQETNTQADAIAGVGSALAAGAVVGCSSIAGCLATISGFFMGTDDYEPETEGVSEKSGESVEPSTTPPGAVAQEGSQNSGDRLPDNAIVCRGGTCTAERFENASGATMDENRRLSDVSVQSAPEKTVEELTKPIPNGQVGVTTAGEIRNEGGDVTPDPLPENPDHCLLCGLLPEELEKLFTPTIKNPSKKKPE